MEQSISHLPRSYQGYKDVSMTNKLIISIFLFPHIFSKLTGMTTSIIKELQNSMDGLSNKLCIEKIKSRNFSPIDLRPRKLSTGLDTHWNMVFILNRSRSKQTYRRTFLIIE